MRPVDLEIVHFGVLVVVTEDAGSVLDCPRPRSRWLSQVLSELRVRHMQQG